MTCYYNPHSKGEESETIVSCKGVEMWLPAARFSLCVVSNKAGPSLALCATWHLLWAIILAPSPLLRGSQLWPFPPGFVCSVTLREGRMLIEDGSSLDEFDRQYNDPPPKKGVYTLLLWEPMNVTSCGKRLSRCN